MTAWWSTASIRVRLTGWYTVVLSLVLVVYAGLGLAIAKWAVEANGGHIAVEAGANGGSVFRVVLPSVPAPAAAHHEHVTQRKGGHA